MLKPKLAYACFTKTHIERRFKLNYEPTLQTAITWISQNFHKRLTIKEIAHACHLSESSLQRLFRKNLQLSPIGYLNKIRINHAKQLLSQPAHSIQYCAFAVGYYDLNTFYRAFKKATGRSPKAWGSKLKID